jgi:hypothetical protein
MVRFLLAGWLVLGGLSAARAQSGSDFRPNGLVIFQTGDTLRGLLRVDLPGNRVLALGLPGGERVYAAADVKYVGLDATRAFRLLSGTNGPTRLNEFTGIARTAHYISAVCQGKMLLFEVLQTGPRVALLFHPPAGGEEKIDPWLAPLRQDWFETRPEGFYLGYLNTNRVVPFRCSLRGLLRVLPYYREEVRRLAWQHPSLTVREAVQFYNSLTPPPYYEPSASSGRHEKGR